ncbi:MAG: Hsp20/alpha crystallin family protein [Candidatus Cloacimonetes bacterium]|nr:Hsp20/alpha crystallin family protein [Candidatus Cloacimonadota bacterium]
MKLAVWNPFHEMETLLEKYGKSSRASLSKKSDKNFEVGDWMPVVDINETDEDFLVKAELPGVAKEDVKISIDNNILLIKGEKKVESEDQKKHYYECSYGSFVRSFTLPQMVKIDEIKADYKNGVLNLKIPKSEEMKPKEIEISIE